MDTVSIAWAGSSGLGVLDTPPLACRPSPPGGEIGWERRLPQIVNVANCAMSARWEGRAACRSPPLWGRWPAGQRGCPTADPTILQLRPSPKTKNLPDPQGSPGRHDAPVVGQEWMAGAVGGVPGAAGVCSSVTGRLVRISFSTKTKTEAPGRRRWRARWRRSCRRERRCRWRSGWRRSGLSRSPAARRRG